MDLVVRTWEEWCRVFNKANVWRPLVEAICKRHDLPMGEIRPGFEGTNAVFVVGEHVVVKIVSPFFPGDYERELEVYHLLADKFQSTTRQVSIHYNRSEDRNLSATTIKGEIETCLEGDEELLTPRVLAEGVLEGTQEWPYMVLSLLPGKRLGEVWAAVPREEQLAIAWRLGEMIRRLHEQPLGAIRSMDTDPKVWEGFVRTQIERAPEHFCRQGLPGHLLDSLSGYLAKLLPLYPVDMRPCLLSADLTEDHVLLDLVDGRWQISGLIDFGDAEVGHADFDFCVVHLWCFHIDQELTGAFLGGYGYHPDERFNERMMGYSLLHRFADMRPWLKELGGAERVRSWEQLQQYLWRVSLRGPECSGR